MDDSSTEKGYQCQRCGEVEHGAHAARRYCAFCGVYELELKGVPNPTAANHESDRLPAAI